MSKKSLLRFMGMCCCAWMLLLSLSGCSTSFGSKGSTALRTYPVPIEFHIAEGAYNNTQ